MAQGSLYPLIDFIELFLQVFREAISSQKAKDTSKTRTNVKTLSRNARRMFAQFNRKKGQIVSHLLDQMANVTGVDDKARKHYELRGRSLSLHQGKKRLFSSQVFWLFRWIILHL